MNRSFKELLLGHFGEVDEDGQPTRAADIAKEISANDNGFAHLDGAALRDALIRHDQDLEKWVWNRFNYLKAINTLNERLPAESPAPALRAEDVTVKRVKFLWHPNLPIGKFVLLEGDPDKAKSLAIIDWAARVTTGDPFPGSTQRRDPAGVVLLSAEDDPEDTVVPRLLAADANLKLVRILTVKHGVVIPEKMGPLVDAVKEVSAQFVGVDPVDAFLDDSRNPGSNISIRGALTPLQSLAAELHFCFTGLRHWNKDPRNPAMYRGSGSIGYVAAARACHSMVKLPDKAGAYVMSTVKNNLARERVSVEYTIQTAKVLVPADGLTMDVPHICWGKVGSLDANDVMRQLTGTKKSPKLAEAKKFLRENLKDGRVSVDELKRRAQKIPISWGSLNRAADELCVVKTKVKKDSIWELEKLDAEDTGM